MESVRRMVSEKPVVIFSKSSCCMSYSIKSLFSDLAVYPAVHELDEIPRGREIEQFLSRIGCNPTVPAVFIGGELVGGENEVIGLHLQGSLKPMLKKAGAIWV
ncbi:monothiol glutaredoxin-S2-like [Ipomoea triloba]|uniref:monothiol glutaredoxin-S2-like n=1 Tax=Ipomoea triloba TaxID=35885 RepID=UPI00125DFCF3|nr:monothiol glutaredoxin-S2-like [Ipomoea triloba]GLL44215.1 monothiol glutaredoxin-S2-like [Ipomoea trifida]